MSSNDTSGRERSCPVCGDTMYQQGAPGVLWCPECEMEYWREGNGWWRCDESGKPENVKAVADGGTAVRGRTLNPETHTAPDYKRLIYETDAALHFYLKDDKEWWVAHGPENEPPGRLNGPWLFWTTYPSGGWELDFFTKEIASHHLEELYYIDYDGNEAHSIHRARLVPMDDAPEFVQEVVGWNSRDIDTDTDRAVHPVVGVILLAAISLLLALIVAFAVIP